MAYPADVAFGSEEDHVAALRILIDEPFGVGPRGTATPLLAAVARSDPPAKDVILGLGVVGEVGDLPEGFAFLVLSREAQADT